MGIMDGFYMAPIFGAPDNDEDPVALATCAEGMKGSQVAAIIEKFAKDHPEHWDWDMKLVAYNATRDGCSKR